MSTSMREALEGAFDESEAEEQEVVEEETGGSNENAEEQVGDAAEEQTGSEDEKEGTGDTEKLPEDTGGDVSDGKSKEASDVRATEEQDTDKSAVKAPASWKPGAREEWGNIPGAAQREIARRETHMDNMLRDSADSRKLQTEFLETIHPFEPLIAAQNSTPMVAIKNLMTTAAGLTLGSPQQKAQVITNIMREYGVEVETLDAVLTGQAMPAQGQTELQTLLAQELAPIKNFMGQLQGQKDQYANNQQVTMESEIETFAVAPENEFFEDVREDMADLMEMAANRNKSMSIPEAYTAACRMHPEISGIIGKRERASNANIGKDDLAKKRQAASSVHGTQVGDGKAASGNTLRSAIEDAVEELS